jgi:hypothetical protein
MVSRADGRLPEPSLTFVHKRWRSERQRTSSRDALRFRSMPDPMRLADIEARRFAVAIVSAVLDRAMRDTPAPLAGANCREWSRRERGPRAVAQSEVFRTALELAEWATSGRGQVVESSALIRQVRADLDGSSATDASTRGPLDLSTVPCVALVAAGARLALIERCTVSAVELATRASMDEHSVRAATNAGTLRPVAAGRPMRFAADRAGIPLCARGAGVRGGLIPLAW